MSDGLEILEDGSASMAYVGDTPWHRMGKKVSNNLLPDEFMEVAGLDWEVEKRPLFFEDLTDTGITQMVDVHEAALIRWTDKKVLSIVGKGWNPIQNREAFEFFREFVEKGDMEMHTAGSLMEGKMVWGLAKINESFELPGGDVVESHLLFSNPHIFGVSADVRFTPIRVVCQNTLSMALGAKSSKLVKINHRKKFDPEAVKEALGMAHVKFDRYKEMAEKLASTRFTQENVVEYFNQIFPKTGVKDIEASNDNGLKSRAAKQAYMALETQPGAEMSKGSFWSAYNAVTYLTNWKLGRTQDTRLASAWFGQHQKTNLKALNLAAEYAQAA
jgi:phage/plasmid-like protein (TIGR03299 family)